MLTGRTEEGMTVSFPCMAKGKHVIGRVRIFYPHPFASFTRVPINGCYIPLTEQHQKYVAAHTNGNAPRAGLRWPTTRSGHWRTYR